MNKTKLISLIDGLRRENSYFKEYFPNVDITEDNVEEIYESVPVINKAEIQMHLRDYITPQFMPDWDKDKLNDFFMDVTQLSNNHDRSVECEGKDWRLETTSGSTGKPFAILKSRAEKMLEAKRLMKCRKKLNRELAWENCFSLLEPTDSVILQSYEKMMCDDELKKIVVHLSEGDYRWILCSALHLRRIYKCAMENHLEKKISKIPIQIIETTSQALAQEEKEDMKICFPNAKFISQYGCREVWNLAYQCPCGGLHINDDYLIIDVVDKNGKIIKDGQIGEVIMTSTIHKSMPFFKYYLGDRARIHYDKCECGSEIPRIELMIGREKQRIIGTELFGNEIFRKVMRYIYFHHTDIGVEKIKIIQTKEKEFEVYPVIKKEDQAIFERYFHESCKYQLKDYDKYMIRFIYEYPFKEEPTALKHEIFENYII